MIVENNKEPFYHTIIHDYFTTEERELIWQELDSLHTRLEGPEVTGDPRASKLKQRLYLDSEYENRRNHSNILSLSRKIFDIEKGIPPTNLYISIKPNSLFLTMELQRIELVDIPGSPDLAKFVQNLIIFLDVNNFDLPAGYIKSDRG